MTRLIVPLVEATDAGAVGAKAANLARLIRLEHPVPDGVAVATAALEMFMRVHRLDTIVSRLMHGLDVREPEGIMAASTAIRSAFHACALPDDLAADLDICLIPLLPERLIVRSSALGEDSADASFAGQLDSVSDVYGAAALRAAILDVWASRWSARALTYQLARGRSLGGVGIVIQRQVDSAISGVLFTRSPHDEREMVLEYCGGAGEALVSGRENPGRVAIGRRDLAWRQIAAPEMPIARGDRLFRQLQPLAARALEVERAFGSPQDIEWTIDGKGGLWLVQARPITKGSTVGFRQKVRTERSDEGFGRTVQFWSNANVNENFPQPISPLLYSIARTGYYHYFRNLGRAFGFSTRRLAAMEEPLRHIIGVHNARMYYNLTSIHGVLRSAPFGEQLAAWFNQFVGSEDTDAPAFVDPQQTSGSALTQAGELAVIVARTTWQYLFVTRRIERFERTVSEYAARTHPAQLARKNCSELLEDLRGFIEIRNHRWLDASLADAASMVCYGALKKTLSAAFPAEDQAALHNSLLKALPDLPSSQPALKLWDLSRMVRADERLRQVFSTRAARDVVEALRRAPEFAAFQEALETFLEEWGFRCSGELMLTVPSFQEDTPPLIEIIKAYAGMDAPSPAEHLAGQREERLRETGRVANVLRERRLLPGLPGVSQWHLVSILLRWTQRAIILRERARLKQALLYSRLRRVALALGGQLAGEHQLEHPEDIFMLTTAEIDDLVTGYSMFPRDVRDLVALRRAAHARLSAVTPPDSMRLPAGRYLPELATPETSAAERAAEPPGGALHGLGVCGGTTSARAAVLQNVTETHLLEPGDVLITRQTDPGWGAVFPLISGLVMERGGMLSHGAIIAREFGIPSVVGVGDATRLIPHGRAVHVDGDRGVVRIEGAA